MQLIPNPIKILSYGCTTGAGSGVQAFWNALINQKDCSSPIELKVPYLKEPAHISCSFFPESHQSKWNSDFDKISFFIQESFHEALHTLSEKTKKNIFENCGVIFSSTKGIIEDLLSEKKTLLTDPLTPLLKNFILLNKLMPKHYCCVSNACGSSHSALYLAQEWMRREALSSVIIISAESIGTFIQNGFYSLKILNKNGTSPFDHNRSGLQLGDATSCIILTHNEKYMDSTNSNTCPTLDSVDIIMEGTSLTRPSTDNKSLVHSLKNCGFNAKNPPDFIIAHATGTVLNDSSEAHAFSEIFFETSPPITSTKWCIGHTLGSSGSLDLISACEALKNKKLFPMGKTKKIDPTFKGRFLIHNEFLSLQNINQSKDKISCAITSLGFGGIHAALGVSL